jgi:hypothetical protein
MPSSIDDLIPSATQIRKDAALKEAEKADEYARLAANAEAEKRALIDLAAHRAKAKPKRSNSPQP